MDEWTMDDWGRRLDKPIVKPHRQSTPSRSSLTMSTDRVIALDHLAIPMRNTEAMLAFYRGLGLPVTETANAVSVHLGEQMINFHRPTRWQDPSFTLRAPAAHPPCGDVCVVWDGTPAALAALLERVGAAVVEGPVERPGGRRRTGSSVYVRDPDGNLVEFMIYA
jgi:catechol 2,3-dioxygenase-like lactoylglutathione lyase family enzyme